MIDNYFRDLTEKGWVIIYMDAILIHVQPKKELESQMKQVLAWFKKHNLYLKLEKCKFVVQEVDFLGMILTKKNDKNGPDKTCWN